jgi:hypothetical protein
MERHAIRAVAATVGGLLASTSVPPVEIAAARRHRWVTAAKALVAAMGLGGLLGAGCVDGGGTLSLALQLPPAGDLRPTGMTSIAVTTQVSGGTANVTTTPLVMDGGALSFAAGEVTAGVPITLQVELRDLDNRLVGFGDVEAPVTPSRSAVTAVDIAVRKPLVYVAGGTSTVTLDPTRDSLDPKYQGTIASVGQAQVVVPIDGTELAVFSGTSMSRVATADHKLVGAAITVPGGVTDAAAVPGGRKVVAATSAGLVVIDVDAGKVTTIALPKVPQRVAVGGSIEAGFIAYALADRVDPPTGAASCPPTASTVTAVRLDVGTPLPLTNTAPLSDLAADEHGLFATDPCGGAVIGFDSTSGHKVLDVQGASAVAITEGRLWIAGSEPPQTGTDASGARVTLTSMATTGGMSQTVKLPPKGEVMAYLRDPRREISINLQADTEVATGIAVQPGNGGIALLTRMDSHRPAKVDATFGEVIPEMTLVVNDLVLADPQTGALLHRVRTRCTLTYNGSQALFDMWQCASVTASEVPSGGEFTPTGVAALFGGR